MAGDTNAWNDTFIRDRETGTTDRVSVSTAGAEANAGSGVGAISADGRYVAFQSAATNLVPGDTNGFMDIFLRDRYLTTTELVSVTSAGEQVNRWSESPSISADGRYVAFVSDADTFVAGDTNKSNDIFVHDRQTGTTERVSLSNLDTEANCASDYARISADGRFVAFESIAYNLVPHDTNVHPDVFVRSRGSLCSGCPGLKPPSAVPLAAAGAGNDTGSRWHETAMSVQRWRNGLRWRARTLRC